MNREAPEPREEQPAPRPTCGNCCNGQKHPKAVNQVICTALPPSVVSAGPGMARNIYPEMPADRLGCTVLWGVNANLVHVLTELLGARLGGGTEPGSPDGKAHGETQTDTDQSSG